MNIQRENNTFLIGANIDNCNAIIVIETKIPGSYKKTKQLKYRLYENNTSNKILCSKDR